MAATHEGAEEGGRNWGFKVSIAGPWLVADTDAKGKASGSEDGSMRQ